MSTTSIIVTIALIVLSAFFVAIEFALLAARRHRLEELAPTSRMARAALRSSAELTLLLAGAQLGITVCTLALGAVTKPAVHHALMPLLEGFGLSMGLADVVAFILALVIVTFLHLVIGEMAPKSWAIAHPERSAMLLAIPMRGFMFLVRPVLRALNAAANWLVSHSGAEPVDELDTVQDAAGLRQLVEHSANVGALDVRFARSIERALDLHEATVGDLAEPASPATLPASATMAAVQQAAMDSGLTRVVLRDGDRITGVVHVRDTLQRDPAEPVGDLAREPYRLAADTALHEALAGMRTTGNHIAIVGGGATGDRIVTLTAILAKLIAVVPPELAR